MGVRPDGLDGAGVRIVGNVALPSILPPQHEVKPVDDAVDSAQGVRTDVSSDRHAVVRNDNGQYAIWPGDLTVPAGWRQVHGPAGRADCRDRVEREWRPAELGFPDGAPVRRAAAGFADTVHGLFRARVAHDPEAVAVIAADATLSYCELDLRSDRLAAALRAAGPAPSRSCRSAWNAGPGW